MKESVNQFIQGMKEDPSFGQKVIECTSKEGVVALAQSQGISLTTEDVDLVNEAMKQEWLESINTETPAGAFVHKMMEDTAFAEKIVTEQDLEEVIKLAAEEGLVLTLEDLQEANQQLQQMTGQRDPTQNGQLSEEDLEQVAGGFALSSITEAVTMSGLMVSASITITAGATFFFTAASISVAHVINTMINGDK